MYYFSSVSCFLCCCLSPQRLYLERHQLQLATSYWCNTSEKFLLGFGDMGRAPCCDKANVKKGPWSPEEDSKLKEFIEKHGTGGNWIALPHKAGKIHRLDLCPFSFPRSCGCSIVVLVILAGLKRCGKSCRLRWLNYLRPNIKHGEFSEEEDRIICSLFATIGSRFEASFFTCLLILLDKEERNPHLCACTKRSISSVLSAYAHDLNGEANVVQVVCHRFPAPRQDGQ